MSEIQKCYLIGIDLPERTDARVSLEELKELTRAAGSTVVGSTLQKRRSIHPGTLIGSGKIEELKEIAHSLDADLIILDWDATPSQINRLEELFELPIVDRTTLILDIFAQRAQTAEGKLQVELAQLEYLYPRLKGQGINLSRLGGGIGTRGPGETKLETDKRHLRRRMDKLKRDLEDLKTQRNNARNRRKKNEIFIVSLAGYTNAGKSTLLNRLTNSNVYSEDMLFATLDPTSRKLILPDGKEVLLIDTVGFIRNLPHQLIYAFQSTLEDIVFSNLILNVCDVSSDEMQSQCETVERIISDLGYQGEIIRVYNKSDLLSERPEHFQDGCLISAKNGDGLEELMARISKSLAYRFVKVTLHIPYVQIGISAEIRKLASSYVEEYCENWIKVECELPVSVVEKYRSFLQKD